MHDRKFKMLGIGLLAVVAIATLVMLLWNALLSAIFGVQSIGFFQALGLLILCKILYCFVPSAIADFLAATGAKCVSIG